MSAIYGTDSAYSSIGGIHLLLNLPGAVNGEYVFDSGTSDKNMMNWKQYMDWILFDKQFVSAEDENKILSRALNKDITSQPNDDTDRNIPVYIYDVIRKTPKLSKFTSMINEVGYGKPVDYTQNYTIFAPVDEKFEEYLYYPLYMGERKNSLFQALRYHILPYVIKPWQLKDRKLKLKTDLENQIVESDWTYGKQLLINPISKRNLPLPYGYENSSMHYGDPYPVFPDTWFPKTEWEVNILASIECANGMLYIISRPLVFPNYL